MATRKKSTSVKKRPSRAEELASLACDLTFAPDEKQFNRISMKMFDLIQNLLEEQADATLERALAIALDEEPDAMEELEHMIKNLASTGSFTRAGNNEPYRCELFAVPIILALATPLQTGQMGRPEGLDLLATHLRKHPFLDNLACNIVVVDYLLSAEELSLVTFSEGSTLNATLAHQHLSEATHAHFRQILDEIKIGWPQPENPRSSDEAPLTVTCGFLMVSLTHETDQTNPFQNPVLRALESTDDPDSIDDDALIDQVLSFDAPLAAWHQEFSELVTRCLGIEIDPESDEQVSSLDPAPFFDALDQADTIVLSLKMRFRMQDEMKRHKVQPAALIVRASCHSNADIMDDEVPEFAFRMDFVSKLTGETVFNLFITQEDTVSIEQASQVMLQICDLNDFDTIKTIEEIQPMSTLYDPAPALPVNLPGNMH